MPNELTDFTPAIRFLERSPDQSLMLLRSLRLGRRPGFAAIVDDPSHVQALLLIDRPDWKAKAPRPTRIQIDAVDARSAVSLLSWLPPIAHARIYSFRPWLQELLLSLFEVEQVAHKVHCVARGRHFKPSPLQGRVREIDPGGHELLAQVPATLGLNGGHRVFGIIESGQLLAASVLAPPDTDYVAVQSVFTQSWVRGRGLGSAVLSAATQAGLDQGKLVTYGLPVEDMPSLHLVAGLGYAPACREWMVQGHPRR